MLIVLATWLQGGRVSANVEAVWSTRILAWIWLMMSTISRMSGRIMKVSRMLSVEMKWKRKIMMDRKVIMIRKSRDYMLKLILWIYTLISWRIWLKIWGREISNIILIFLNLIRNKRKCRIRWEKILKTFKNKWKLFKSICSINLQRKEKVLKAVPDVNLQLQHKIKKKTMPITKTSWTIVSQRSKIHFKDS